VNKDLLLKIFEWVAGLSMIGVLNVLATTLNGDAGDKEPVIIMGMLLLGLYAIQYVVTIHMFRRTGKNGTAIYQSQRV
jgi:hypothetical protein